MKHSNFKDFQKRLVVKKFELILLQKKMSKILRRRILESQNAIVRDSQIKNRCILTGRPKGICSDFKLSRIKTRELALNGLINGLKKVSW
jgi:small subunit ribosomal protein S14